MPKAPTPPFDLASALLDAFLTNDRISRYLIENIPLEAWHAKPPEGKGRTIAAIAAHMHNVRRMWLKAVGSATVPDKADESDAPKEILAALGASRDALAEVLKTAFATGKVKGFQPDAASFFGYLIAHDAHHRGQIMTLARRLGHPVSQSAHFGLWEWGSRAKEIG